MSVGIDDTDVVAVVDDTEWGNDQHIVGINRIRRSLSPVGKVDTMGVAADATGQENTMCFIVITRVRRSLSPVGIANIVVAEDAIRIDQVRIVDAEAVRVRRFKK